MGIRSNWKFKAKIETNLLIIFQIAKLNTSQASGQWGDVILALGMKYKLVVHLFIIHFHKILDTCVPYYSAYSNLQCTLCSTSTSWQLLSWFFCEGSFGVGVWSWHLTERAREPAGKQCTGVEMELGARWHTHTVCVVSCKVAVGLNLHALKFPKHANLCLSCVLVDKTRICLPCASFAK